MRRSRRYLLAGLTGVALVVSACGSSSKSETTATTKADSAATTAAASATTAAGAATTAGSGAATTAKSGTATTAAAAGGAQTNAKWVADAEAAGKAKALKATGDPIVIGFQTPEGDPAGTFPEYRLAADAAVKYVNEELGGIGADYKAGKPGRPIKLESCAMAITPADSQRCANELVAKKPFAVISTINFFGNHFAIYKAANIPVVVATPVTALDFTSPGVYAVSGGGGCLGAHTGLIEFITKDLGKKKIGVPWADTPPGVFCYNDLEKKPLEVLAGKKLTGADIKAEGNTAKGTIKDLTHIGVAVKPGQADVTPQATQVLDFKPDGLVFSGQGADCWTLFNSLTKLGWSPATTPIVMSGSCLDLAKMKEIGDATKGVYFIGGASILNPESLSGQLKDEALTYAAKMKQYADGGSDTAGKGFATTGFATIMQVWEIASIQANGDASKLDPAAFTKALGATSNHHAWGSTGLSCADGTQNAPYISVCNSTVTATQWDGSKLVPKRENFSGLYLIKGTDLDFGK